MEQIFNKTTQYTAQSINTFEYTFGKGYMSAGGQAMTGMMAKAIQAPRGANMLDIGFGIGGAAFDFAGDPARIRCGSVGPGFSGVASGAEAAPSVFRWVQRRYGCPGARIQVE